jgi:hypothetical protein
MHTINTKFREEYDLVLVYAQQDYYEGASHLIVMKWIEDSYHITAGNLSYH